MASLCKAWLKPFLPEGFLSAGEGVWLISHSCYRNIWCFTMAQKLKKSQLKHKSQIQSLKTNSKFAPKNGWFPSSESPNFQWFAPILAGALSKVFSSRRPEPAEPPWWSRGGNRGTGWVDVGHVLVGRRFVGWLDSFFIKDSFDVFGFLEFSSWKSENLAKKTSTKLQVSKQKDAEKSLLKIES